MFDPFFCRKDVQDELSFGVGHTFWCDELGLMSKDVKSYRWNNLYTSI